MLSISVLTNEVCTAWSAYFLVLASNGTTFWLCLVKSVSFISLGDVWGSSASEILIFGWVLTCIGSGVNRVTVDFSADINNELSHRKQNISVR